MKLWESIDELWFQFNTVAIGFREPNASWKRGPHWIEPLLQ